MPTHIVRWLLRFLDPSCMVLFLSDRVGRFTGSIFRAQATHRNIVVLLFLLMLSAVAKVTTPSRYLVTLVHVYGMLSLKFFHEELTSVVLGLLIAVD